MNSNVISTNNFYNNQILDTEHSYLHKQILPTHTLSMRNFSKENPHKRNKLNSFKLVDTRTNLKSMSTNKTKDLKTLTRTKYNDETSSDTNGNFNFRTRINPNAFSHTFIKKFEEKPLKIKIKTNKINEVFYKITGKLNLNTIIKEHPESERNYLNYMSKFYKDFRKNKKEKFDSENILNNNILDKCWNAYFDNKENNFKSSSNIFISQKNYKNFSPLKIKNSISQKLVTKSLNQENQDNNLINKNSESNCKSKNNILESIKNLKGPDFAKQLERDLHFNTG